MRYSTSNNPQKNPPSGNSEGGDFTFFAFLDDIKQSPDLFTDKKTDKKVDTDKSLKLPESFERPEQKIDLVRIIMQPTPLGKKSKRFKIKSSIFFSKLVQKWSLFHLFNKWYRQFRWFCLKVSIKTLKSIEDKLNVTKIAAIFDVECSMQKNTVRYIISISVFFLIGSSLQWQKYKGLTWSECLVKKFPLIYKTDMCYHYHHNWKTFSISDSKYLLGDLMDHKSVSHLYPKLEFNKHSISVALTPLWHNRINQLYFGLIDFDLTPKSYFNNFFQVPNFNDKIKYPIYIESSNPNLYDVIPRKMEATLANVDYRRNDLLNVTKNECKLNAKEGDPKLLLGEQRFKIAEPKPKIAKRKPAKRKPAKSRSTKPKAVKSRSNELELDKFETDEFESEFETDEFESEFETNELTTSELEIDELTTSELEIDEVHNLAIKESTIHELDENALNSIFALIEQNHENLVLDQNEKEKLKNFLNSKNKLFKVVLNSKKKEPLPIKKISETYSGNSFLGNSFKLRDWTCYIKFDNIDTRIAHFDKDFDQEEYLKNCFSRIRWRKVFSQIFRERFYLRGDKKPSLKARIYKTLRKSVRGLLFRYYIHRVAFFEKLIPALKKGELKKGELKGELKKGKWRPAHKRVVLGLITSKVKDADLLEVAKRANFYYFNKKLRPRLLSGYQQPDHIIDPIVFKELTRPKVVQEKGNIIKNAQQNIRLFLKKNAKNKFLLPFLDVKGNLSQSMDLSQAKYQRFLNTQDVILKVNFPRRSKALFIELFLDILDREEIKNFNYYFDRQSYECQKDKLSDFVSRQRHSLSYKPFKWMKLPLWITVPIKLSIHFIQNVQHSLIQLLHFIYSHTPEKVKYLTKRLVRHFRSFLYSQIISRIQVKDEWKNTINEWKNTFTNILFHIFDKCKNTLNEWITSLLYRRHPSWGVRKSVGYRFEALSSYSWFSLTKLGGYIVGYKYLRFIYKQYVLELADAVLKILIWIGVIKDPEWWLQELQLKWPVDYRAVRQVDRTFSQTVGIEPLIAGLSDSLWYFRAQNQPLARLFWPFYQEERNSQSFTRLQPILLIGPPGTGKTLLVRTLASEIEIPVLLQTGGLVQTGGKFRRTTVQRIFSRAREIAPCIVFIDEIDGPGQRRGYLPACNNPYALDSDLGTLHRIDTLVSEEPNPTHLETYSPESTFIDFKKEEIKLEEEDIVYWGESPREAEVRKLKRPEVINKAIFKRLRRRMQLKLLLILLDQIDKLEPKDNILLIGATNRYHALDEALMRPGRFSRMINFKLPNQRLRMQLLKLYIDPMGIENIETANSPDFYSFMYYMAQDMEGLSPADIAVAVNESALLSALDGKKHTFSTLDLGIQRVTTYGVEVSERVFRRNLGEGFVHLRSRWFFNRFYKTNYQLNNEKTMKETHFYPSKVKDFSFSTMFRKLAYYESGNTIVKLLLPYLTSNVAFNIQRRPKNFRYESLFTPVLECIENLGLSFRFQLEPKLVSMLAGKASELLSSCASLRSHMQPMKYCCCFWLKRFASTPNIDMTDLGYPGLHGYSGIYPANLLAFIMVDKWYFYAEMISTQHYHPILENVNLFEMDLPERQYFEAINASVRIEIDRKYRIVPRRQTPSQKRSYTGWWTKQLQDVHTYWLAGGTMSPFLEWSRWFLPDLEENELNVEWCPPDLLYNPYDLKEGNVFSNPSSTYVLWYRGVRVAYEHIHNSLLFNCLNVGYSILNQNLELLDYLVDFVLRSERVGNAQVQALIEPFHLYESEKVFQKVNLMDLIDVNFENLRKDEFAFFEDWGTMSRRKVAHTLNLDEIKRVIPDEDLSEEQESSSDQFLPSDRFQKLHKILPKFYLLLNYMRYDIRYFDQHQQARDQEYQESLDQEYLNPRCLDPDYFNFDREDEESLDQDQDDFEENSN